MTDVALSTLAATTAIVFASTVLRAVSGLGFSLAAVPLLSLIWPPQQAVAIAALFQTVSTLPLLASQFRLIDWRVLARLIAGGLVGLVPGLALLRCLHDTALRVTMTLVLLLSIAMIVSGRRLIHTMPPVRVALVGATAGFGQGLSGVPGPALMAGLLAMPELEPRVVRVTATAIFLILGSVSVASFALHGAFGAMHDRDYAIIMFGMIGGHLVGERLFALASATGFRRIVLVVLVASALVTLAPLLV